MPSAIYNIAIAKGICFEGFQHSNLRLSKSKRGQVRDLTNSLPLSLVEGNDGVELEEWVAEGKGWVDSCGVNYGQDARNEQPWCR